jgi:type VI protein secretion system component Hcp
MACNAQRGIYLYYPGITTAKGTAGHPDEIYLLAYSNGFSKEAGKAPFFTEYAMTKYNDITSDAIQNALTLGTVTDGVEIRIYKAESQPVQVIQLKGVTINSFSTGGTDGELSGCSTCTGFNESFTLAFTAIKIGGFSWNQITNSATF